MIKRRSKQRHRSSRIYVKINNQIHFPQVRVLSEQGDMIGVMPTREAVSQARQANKDLVLITEQAKPPVAKIIELAKHRYQLQQRLAQQRKKAKAQELKEVRFTPFMSDNDFQARLGRVIRFLNKGDKVKLSLLFKGRSITKKEFGYEMFKRVFAETTELADVERQPKMVGRSLVAQLMPVKNGLKPAAT
ncbi:MAG: translation initiation factor IF-3 [Candidatus Pacebacteria bacterium CG10_big_fil_rev_8_21_14_0_10_56_10]|nr:MAG: translation initiation factor IF-3 [Candidatus Pacebacteria bacterium CG10_big_fil_rev_8_21_14_0_10_56_10]